MGRSTDLPLSPSLKTPVSDYTREARNHVSEAKAAHHEGLSAEGVRARSRLVEGQSRSGALWRGRERIGQNMACKGHVPNVGDVVSALGHHPLLRMAVLVADM